MCLHQPWEDSLPIEDYTQSIGNDANNIVTGWHSWQARIAMLEARVARIEARVDGLEARMFFQQKALQIMCVLFLVTLVYAIYK
ncbi:hypothetical protein COLO4_03362 [Corchorus olitorius]|uniref:Uncharacterized protein n=1 Tax=Corchorus olitorius TaxID=93759 RepID=A0A1R3KYS0_9ROSI|nr:hypothetical protein COLO4_03362 [Corchorus olitorius]